MTAPRDLDDRVRAYLEDGPTELPNRSFDAVRNQIDQTRQRVVLGPWRFPQMTNFARLGIAAAAIVVAAVVGLKLVPSPGTGGIPTATTATPAPTATPTPAATPNEAGAFPLPISGSVPPGTYYRDEGWRGGPKILVTHTLPAGWTSNEGSFLYKAREQPGEVMFITWVVTHIYEDACDWDDSSLIEIGPAPADLISALARQNGRAETAGAWPWNGTIAGLPAEGVELEVPADLDTSTCTNGMLRYWPDPGPDFTGGLCCNQPGNRDFIYAVDVEGQTVAVVARHYAESSAQDVAELQAILRSLKLETQ